MQKKRPAKRTPRAAATPPLSQRVKMRFVALMMSYGLYTTIFLSMPVIFYRPDLECATTDSDSDAPRAAYVSCSEDEMCANHSPYRFNAQYAQIQSFSMEKNLYCDRKILEAMMLSLPSAVRTIGYVLNLVFGSAPRRYYDTVTVTQFVVGCVLVSVAAFDSVPYVIFAILVWNLGLCWTGTHSFAYSRTFAPPQLRGKSTALVSFGWPILAIVYALFVTRYGHWKQTLVYAAGAMSLLNAALLWAYRPLDGEDGGDANADAPPAPQGTASAQRDLTFRDHYNQLSANPVLLKNFLIMVMTYTMYNIAYGAFYVSLNSIGGNIFFNTFAASLMELISGGASLYFLGSVDMVKTLHRLLLVTGGAYISCALIQGVRVNRIAEDSSWSQMIVWLLPMFIGNVTNQAVYPFTLELLKDVLESPEQQTFMNTFGNFTSLVSMTFTPYIKYFMTDVVYVNQFIGYGIMVLIVSRFTYQVKKLKDIKKNNEKPLLPPQEMVDVEKV